MAAEKRDFNIVLVYLGNKPPRYLKSNIYYLQKQFPDFKTWLITDLESVKNKYSKEGVNVWFYNDGENIWSNIYEEMSFPKEFRNGFWFLTLKRFKALEAFMSKNAGSVLHVEGDVFLMPTFPVSEIQIIEEDLAFPIVGTGYAISSTLFIRNHNAISLFNEFISQKAKTDSNLIDMTALFDYSKKFPERVHILPSGPESDPLAKGFFDGAAFGTFLLGQDPRNRRGKSLKYSAIDWHSDKVNELEFKIEENQLFAIHNETKTQIYSLHVHSKDSRLFDELGIFLGLSRALEEYKDGPRSVLKLESLWGILTTALLRRLLKVVKSD